MPISAYFAATPLQIVYTGMCAFTRACGVGVEKKLRIEEWGEVFVQEVMDIPIPHRGTVDGAIFGVENAEGMVGAMCVVD